MRQICALVYHVLTEGKTQPQIAELDVLLSAPEDKEEMLAKQNAEAMKALHGMGPAGFIPPPPKRRAKP